MVYLQETYVNINNKFDTLHFITLLTQNITDTGLHLDISLYSRS